MEDPNSESRLPPGMSLNIYFSRDEQFGQLKMLDFLAYVIKSIFTFLVPKFKARWYGIREFDSFQDTLNLYGGGIKLPQGPSLDITIPFQILKTILRTDDEGYFKFPTPQIIEEDKTAWRTDEEFAREMLARLNLVIICCLQEFPLASNLDPKVYGNQNSSITRDHIKNNPDGLTVEEAIENNMLFILDHHDALMSYATRTLIFLQSDGTLKPLAIELSLPYPQVDQFGAISKVYTPSEHGVESFIWQLAKAYIAVNDFGYHQLISHWLNTHAVIEPFMIATNRQLSVFHPIYKLLDPGFCNTRNINALTRQNPD
ncbi:hypothetical protein HYC85_010201 [Camellia sinensis]|uniref:Lipoxygenase domain-containing protein n=1 Tax=Camellia sinensis TaxID=4442 RepID=A0A7J7HIP4_CAMSI|nr:hypothetical protein HYC85_010201 [Camellia sinensis]